MKAYLLLTILSASYFTVQAGRITGTITNDKGELLTYASILVKGTTKGTTANNEGKYFLQLEPGTYTIIARYVGYERQEKTITIGKGDAVLDFSLTQQQLALKEVVVRPGAEDPAYEIIRNAIKKREYYLNQLEKFQSEVYIKGQMRLRNYPKQFFGQVIDFEDGDTSKKKMIYLSETIARYSVEKPNKSKIEVLSTKVSGESDGYGFSAPQIISFYENNIQVGRNLNPRGFVSPIANGALSFYRYRFEGSFIEEGKEIHKITVIPKRKYEPLFSGTINITEGDWRIHSLQLQLTKESQMELVDTLRIEQLYVPYNHNVWVIKTQVLYPAVKIFGFDAYGSFVNVYSKFDIEPALTKKFFNNTYLKFYEGSNKKPADYWDSIRPVPLQLDEIKDYHKKDSLEQVRKEPHYMDSLDRRRNKIKPLGILLFGQNISKEKKRAYISIKPVISAAGYNTVEGWYLNLSGNYSRRPDTTNTRRSINFSPVIRYGFNNKHLNIHGVFNYTYGQKYISSIRISGGKRVYQLNHSNPVTPLSNTIQSLFFEHNYAKYYEAWFAQVSMTKGMGNGVTVTGGLEYNDRLPLENTTTWTIRDDKEKQFLPNYPEELVNKNFDRHQAVIAHAAISWRPGARYIEYPDRTINIGSRYPTFTLNYWQGINHLLGSDIDYSKWRFNITDNLNLKLLGNIRYNMAIGGFLNRDSVSIADFHHFNGNRVMGASNYLTSFQLLPYYKYSNKKQFYFEGHLEHHFNGLLTNKIPLFRRLNWHLVTGTNAFYLDRNNQYIEFLVGLENILKLVRADFVWGFEKGHPNTSTGFRISVRGFATGGSGD